MKINRNRGVARSAVVLLIVCSFFAGLWCEREFEVLFPAAGLIAKPIPLPPADSNKCDTAARETFIYNNSLTPVKNPASIFSNSPDFLAPLVPEQRMESAPLIRDDNATLQVRAWRYSYNTRCIVEMNNFLDGRKTALIVVHPWGIDDKHGVKTPEPAGTSFFGTPLKNRLYLRHTAKILNPFIQHMRKETSLVAYALIGSEDEIRARLYKSPKSAPGQTDKRTGHALLKKKFGDFSFSGHSTPATLQLTTQKTVADYFQKFPGIDSTKFYNNKGYWDLPIPVVNTIEIKDDDYVIYDNDGYESVKSFLSARGIQHVLLTGYATDACYMKTTAGYINLRKDFNVFLVGDATMALFPAQANPGAATTAALALASLDNLITETSWISALKKPADAAQ